MIKNDSNEVEWLFHKPQHKHRVSMKKYYIYERICGFFKLQKDLSFSSMF